MIRKIALSEIAMVCGGILTGSDAEFSEISIDTRTLQAGDLFFAIKGPNFNAVEFLDVAYSKGAVAAVVDQTIAHTQLPLIEVADVRIALGKTGAYNRKLSNARVVGLTGSQGKTSVKEMTSAILSEYGNVLSTRGNLNNDIGVPLTLSRLSADHEFAVIEMGASGKGEIAYTVNLVKPHVAHITNASGTHLEGFGSLDGVAQAKGEIYGGIIDGGTAVINIDDHYGDYWLNISQHQKIVTISALGNKQADYHVSDVHLSVNGMSTFMLHYPQGCQQISLPLLGFHNVGNALAAIALAMEAGANIQHVVSGLANIAPVPGRMQPLPGRAGSLIINDSYNASPASFKAAIDVLSAFQGKRIVVAGDMAELGTDEMDGHLRTGRHAKQQGIDLLIAVGELSRFTADGYGSGAVWLQQRDHVLSMLMPLLEPGVTVLVKGSRSAGMEKLVSQLIKEEE
jgi:UDP-N-acetylmuramoyl-tripeptide--D-alanyl-D-alanine ligase